MNYINNLFNFHFFDKEGNLVDVLESQNNISGNVEYFGKIYLDKVSTDLFSNERLNIFEPFWDGSQIVYGLPSPFSLYSDPSTTDYPQIDKICYDFILLDSTHNKIFFYDFQENSEFNLIEFNKIDTILTKEFDPIKWNASGFYSDDQTGDTIFCKIIDTINDVDYEEKLLNSLSVPIALSSDYEDLFDRDFEIRTRIKLTPFDLIPAIAPFASINSFQILGEVEIIKVLLISSTNTININSTEFTISYNSNTGITTISHTGNSLYLNQIADYKISFELKPKYDKIAQFYIYGETIGEDDRFKVWLRNLGIDIPQQEFFIFRQSDIKEELPDWNIINSKRKEMLLEGSQIKNYTGAYKGFINAINFYGYKDLTIKEYWKNAESGYLIQKELSENFDSKLDYNPNKNIFPNKNWKKTNSFSLHYNLNEVKDGFYDEEGLPLIQESFDFTNEEVLIKLTGLKNILKKKYLPNNAKIIDITGEAQYYAKNDLVATTNDIRIDRINSGVLPEIKVISNIIEDQNNELSFGFISDLRPLLVEIYKYLVKNNPIKKLNWDLTGFGDYYYLSPKTNFLDSIQVISQDGIKNNLYFQNTDFTIINPNPNNINPFLSLVDTNLNTPNASVGDYFRISQTTPTPSNFATDGPLIEGSENYLICVSNNVAGIWSATSSNFIYVENPNLEFWQQSIIVPNTTLSNDPIVNDVVIFRYPPTVIEDILSVFPFPSVNDPYFHKSTEILNAWNPTPKVFYDYLAQPIFFTDTPLQPQPVSLPPYTIGDDLFYEHLYSAIINKNIDLSLPSVNELFLHYYVSENENFSHFPDSENVPVGFPITLQASGESYTWETLETNWNNLDNNNFKFSNQYLRESTSDVNGVFVIESNPTLSITGERWVKILNVQKYDSINGWVNLTNITDYTIDYTSSRINTTISILVSSVGDLYRIKICGDVSNFEYFELESNMFPFNLVPKTDIYTNVNYGEVGEFVVTGYDTSFTTYNSFRIWINNTLVNLSDYSINSEFEYNVLNCTGVTPVIGDQIYIEYYYNETGETWETIDFINLYEIEWLIEKNITSDSPQEFSYTKRGLINDVKEISIILPYKGFYNVTMSLFDGFNHISKAIKNNFIEVRTKNADIVGYTNIDFVDYNWDNYNVTWEESAGDWDIPVINNLTWDDFDIEWDSLNVSNYIDFNRFESLDNYKWDDLENVTWDDMEHLWWDSMNWKGDNPPSFEIRRLDEGSTLTMIDINGVEYSWTVPIIFGSYPASVLNTYNMLPPSHPDYSSNANIVISDHLEAVSLFLNTQSSYPFNLYVYNHVQDSLSSTQWIQAISKLDTSENEVTVKFVTNGGNIAIGDYILKEDKIVAEIDYFDKVNGLYFIDFSTTPTLMINNDILEINENAYNYNSVVLNPSLPVITPPTIFNQLNKPYLNFFTGIVNFPFTINFLEDFNSFIPSNYKTCQDALYPKLMLFQVNGNPVSPNDFKLSYTRNSVTIDWTGALLPNGTNINIQYELIESFDAKINNYDLENLKLNLLDMNEFAKFMNIMWLYGNYPNDFYMDKLQYNYIESEKIIQIMDNNMILPTSYDIMASTGISFSILSDGVTYTKNKKQEIATNVNGTYVQTKNKTIRNFWDYTNVFTNKKVVKLATQVLFTYDNSKILGKQNPKWTLILNDVVIKEFNEKWFSYIFLEKGEYSLKLDLYDTNGNISTVEKIGFIQVK